MHILTNYNRDHISLEILNRKVVKVSYLFPAKP